jgi:hypothetical protein
MTGAERDRPEKGQAIKVDKTKKNKASTGI